MHKGPGTEDQRSSKMTEEKVKNLKPDDVVYIDRMDLLTDYYVVSSINLANDIYQCTRFEWRKDWVMKEKRDFTASEMLGLGSVTAINPKPKLTNY